MKSSAYKRSQTEGMKTTGCNPAAACGVFSGGADRRERVSEAVLDLSNPNLPYTIYPF